MVHSENKILRALKTRLDLDGPLLKHAYYNNATKLTQNQWLEL